MPQTPHNPQQQRTDAEPVRYLPTDTTESLCSAQLRLLTRTDPDILLFFIKENTVFDAERIRLLLEMGIEAARTRLTAMPAEAGTDAG